MEEKNVFVNIDNLAKGEGWILAGYGKAKDFRKGFVEVKDEK